MPGAINALNDGGLAARRWAHVSRHEVHVSPGWVSISSSRHFMSVLTCMSSWCAVHSHCYCSPRASDGSVSRSLASSSFFSLGWQAAVCFTAVTPLSSSAAASSVPFFVYMRISLALFLFLF